MLKKSFSCGFDRRIPRHASRNRRSYFNGFILASYSWQPLRSARSSKNRTVKPFFEPSVRFSFCFFASKTAKISFFNPRASQIQSKKGRSERPLQVFVELVYAFFKNQYKSKPQRKAPTAVPSPESSKWQPVLQINALKAYWPAAGRFCLCKHNRWFDRSATYKPR